MDSFDALCFDLDDTLLDSSFFKQSINDTCEAIANKRPGVTASALIEANGRVFRSYCLESIDDWTLGRLSGASLGLEAWRRTLEECGQTDEALVNFAASTHQRSARETYRLFSDVHEIFQRLASARVPVGLVTNGASDTQRDKLEAMGIIDFFNVLSISGETRVAKPDPLAFDLVLNDFGFAAKRVWHIGDNLKADVSGAQAAGLTGVWLNRKGDLNTGRIKPDLTISSLVELTKNIRGDP